ncbi:MAG: Flp pilus assembly complex ATPase component TadA [Thermoproteus sp.]|nr:Flp pilus assembly complex ATPase component TadA [Thermoproteus sp.]
MPSFNRHQEEGTRTITWPVVAMGRSPSDGDVVFYAEVSYPADGDSVKITSKFEVRRFMLYDLPSYRAYLWDEVEPELAMKLDASAERILEAVGKGVSLKKAIRRYAGTDDERAVLLMDRFLRHYGAFTALFMLRPKGVTDVYVYAPGSSSVGVHAAVEKVGIVQVDVGPVDYYKWTIYLLRQVSRRTKSPLNPGQRPTDSVVDLEYNARFTRATHPVAPPAAIVRLLSPSPITLPQLVAKGMLDSELAAKLWLLAEERVPILIVGPMGSGKTTLANALVNMVSSVRRIAMIQDVAELIPIGLATLLNEREAWAQGIRPIRKADLMRIAVRSGADLLLINEVADAEDAKGFALAVAAGHGGITTLHAGDKEEALARMRVWGVDVDWLRERAVWVKTTLRHVVTPDGRVELRRIVEYADGVDEKIEELSRVLINLDRQLILRKQFIEGAGDLNAEELVRYLRAFYISPDLVFKPPEIPVEEEVPKMEPPPEVVETLKGVEDFEVPAKAHPEEATTEGVASPIEEVESI